MRSPIFAAPDNLNPMTYVVEPMRAVETLACFPSLLHLGLSQLQLCLSQGVEGLSVGAKLSTDLRHITVSTSRQHAGSGSVGVGEDNLLAEPSHLAFKTADPRFDVVIRHGVTLSRSPSATSPPVPLLRVSEDQLAARCGRARSAPSTAGSVAASSSADTPNAASNPSGWATAPSPVAPTPVPVS
jgi:hypothetical protein